ncbi:MAG: Tol-Pal system beta propeller repeat protein TolB [Zetaproteobacteria bacterium]|nr:MAG: Tol-Pal system beta propeller repeat protein TolB [Zetaproteobacteria bacterium]
MRAWFLLSILLVPLLGSAAEFEIYQSDYKPLKLAVLTDASADIKAQQASFDNIVRNDLASSQSFVAMNPLSFLAEAKETWQSIDYGDWRVIGTDTLALCTLKRNNEGWTSRVRVYSPFQEKLLAETEVTSPNPSLRRHAHAVADFIYKAVLNLPGYFNSHLLFVQKHGNYADLVYMDQDTANRQTVGRRFTLLLSPDWSPDGHQVALNTYVGNHPRLEFFDLRTGHRTTFGDFPGLNSTPEFSPDGRFVAATLSHTGNSEIHIYDLKTRTWRQFTFHPGIDTTPTWSPDGTKIAFVSNRSGHPQIYIKPVAGGKATLVTHTGNYNTSPAWSPQGDRIALVTLKNWSYAIATVRTDGSDIRYLATGDRVESPAWSPNGQMIIYSAEEHHIRRLYRIPSWGGKPEAITPPNIDASDPAWSRNNVFP